MRSFRWRAAPASSPFPRGRTGAPGSASPGVLRPFPWRGQGVRGLRVAGELAVLGPVGARHVLDDNVDLVGGRLGDVHHRQGDRRGERALLLDGAALVRLNRDDWDL